MQTAGEGVKERYKGAHAGGAKPQRTNTEADRTQPRLPILTDNAAANSLSNLLQPRDVRINNARTAHISGAECQIAETHCCNRKILVPTAISQITRQFPLRSRSVPTQFSSVLTLFPFSSHSVPSQIPRK